MSVGVSPSVGQSWFAIWIAPVLQGLELAGVLANGQLPLLSLPRKAVSHAHPEYQAWVFPTDLQGCS